MKMLEKIKNLRPKIRLIAILSVEFIAIITILLLVLFAGKKTHTVTFDLNGGVLLGGEVVVEDAVYNGKRLGHVMKREAL